MIGWTVVSRLVLLGALVRNWRVNSLSNIDEPKQKKLYASVYQVKMCFSIDNFHKYSAVILVCSCRLDQCHLEY